MPATKSSTPKRSRRQTVATKPEATPKPKRQPKAPPWDKPTPQLMESITEVLQELPHKHVQALRNALEDRPDALRADFREFGYVGKIDGEVEYETQTALNRILQLLPAFTPMYLLTLRDHLEKHVGPDWKPQAATHGQNEAAKKRDWATPERADLTGYPEWFNPTRLAKWREDRTDSIDRLIVAVFTESEEGGLGEAIAQFPLVGTRGLAEYASEFIERHVQELRQSCSPSVGFIVDAINQGRVGHEQIPLTLPIVGGDPEADEEKGGKAS